MKLFSGNFKIDDIAKTKIKQDQEIENHEMFIKNIKPLVQDLKIDELKQKEIELIDILKKELLWLDKLYSFFKSFEDILMFSEFLYVTDMKSKLQYEINILILDLREKGIIR